MLRRSRGLSAPLVAVRLEQLAPRIDGPLCKELPDQLVDLDCIAFVHLGCSKAVVCVALSLHLGVNRQRTGQEHSILMSAIAERNLLACAIDDICRLAGIVCQSRIERDSLSRGDHRLAWLAWSMIRLRWRQKSSFSNAAAHHIDQRHERRVVIWILVTERKVDTAGVEREPCPAIVVFRYLYNVSERSLQKRKRNAPAGLERESLASLARIALAPLSLSAALPKAPVPPSPSKQRCHSARAVRWGKKWAMSRGRATKVNPSPVQRANETGEAS